MLLKPDVYGSAIKQLEVLTEEVVGKEPFG
jgi:hypothetical protein